MIFVKRKNLSSIIGISILVLVFLGFIFMIFGCGQTGGTSGRGISGTVTGATSETIALMLFTDLGEDPVATQEVTLSHGVANYSFSGLENGSYYVVMYGPRSGDCSQEPQACDLLGIYQIGNPTLVTVNNSFQTGINFPITCFTGLDNPVTEYYVSGQISTATTESYYITVVISTSETLITGVGNIIINAGYYLEPISQGEVRPYYFSGIPTAEDTYYFAAWQDTPPPNSGISPEAGDYVGTAMVTVSASNPNPTNVDINLQYFGGTP